MATQLSTFLVFILIKVMCQPTLVKISSTEYNARIIQLFSVVTHGQIDGENQWILVMMVLTAIT